MLGRDGPRAAADDVARALPRRVARPSRPVSEPPDASIRHDRTGMRARPLVPSGDRGDAEPGDPARRRRATHSAPSCAIAVAQSSMCQERVIRPSSTVWMSIVMISKLLPAGSMPRKGPAGVPRATLRTV